MKKFFFFCMMALVAMCGLNSCSDDCDHEFIEYDYNKALVGTWTCLEANYAEALVINADGSVLSTGVEDGEYWENIKGNIKTVNNKMTMIFEDNDNFEGRFEMLSGEAFTIYEENGESFTYRYCANDLSDEIVGMWVCDQGDNNIAITTYSEDGKMTMTREAYEHSSTSLVNAVSDYRVIGDLRFHIIPEGDAIDGKKPYLVARMVYTPNGTDLGDILTQTLYTPTENGVVEATTSWLRIKQHLNLTGQIYDYNTAYVTNAKGADEDFTIMGNTFNIAKIKAGDFDKMFRADLFSVELDANSFKYKLRLDNGQDTGFDAPMTVDGNKVTLDMSAINPALRKVDMYMFQDANDTQVHVYMHTDAFINYFANMEVYTLILEGKIDPTDAAAIEKVYTHMEERVESINVSFVLKARE